MWKTLGSKTIFENKFLKLKEDHIRTASGKIDDYWILDRRDFTLVIAKNKNKFFMVNQYRYPVNERSLEFMKGGLEEGEAPRDFIRNLDDFEDGLEMTELTKAQISEKIQNGEIKDAPTIAAWAMYILNYDKC